MRTADPHMCTKFTENFHGRQQCREIPRRFHLRKFPAIRYMLVPYTHTVLTTHSLSLCRMPEFRFRRKKKKQQTTARRHTVHDAEEAHAQVAAAREMVNREEVSERGEGRGREWVDGGGGWGRGE